MLASFISLRLRSLLLMVDVGDFWAQSNEMICPGSVV